MKTLDTIPYEYVSRSLSFDPKKSSFSSFLESVLDPVVVEGLVEQYQLGVTKAGDVIFFQIDKEGRCRTGKVMKYDPVTGHRIKDDSSDYSVTWIHTLMKRKGLLRKDWALSQCLFGEHLLSRYPEREVALVESEETAVICAGFLSEYIWLATGGKTNLDEKLNALSGRKVVAYPNVNTYDYWRKYLAGYSNISVSDYLQKAAGSDSSSGHMDLADLILESITQNSATQNPTFLQIKQYISPKCHDEIEALIKDLDLEFWGVVKIEEKEIE